MTRIRRVHEDPDGLRNRFLRNHDAPIYRQPLEAATGARRQDRFSEPVAAAAGWAETVVAVRPAVSGMTEVHAERRPPAHVWLADGFVERFVVDVIDPAAADAALHNRRRMAAFTNRH